METETSLEKELWFMSRLPYSPKNVSLIRNQSGDKAREVRSKAKWEALGYRVLDDAEPFVIVCPSGKDFKKVKVYDVRDTSKARSKPPKKIPITQELEEIISNLGYKLLYSDDDREMKISKSSKTLWVNKDCNKTFVLCKAIGMLHSSSLPLVKATAIGTASAFIVSWRFGNEIKSLNEKAKAAILQDKKDCLNSSYRIANKLTEAIVTIKKRHR